MSRGSIARDKTMTSPQPPTPTCMDVSMVSCCDDEEDVPQTQSFPFPFTPYSIQEDFMRALYGTIEEGKIGIFESPTGTVGSLQNPPRGFVRFWRIQESGVQSTFLDLGLDVPIL